ncbi:MAG TPA: Scr1 family TA system antitoxin-like transcriptional regulator [Streptosporangiaceae bacterium]|nr:Scr1 family TA system antitoxin-like transcriptional regulator [Streptosporangiaceae bacterium]
MAPVGQRPDPEAQAGRALRRLRLAQNWSQEEVAVRMANFGYDFHQTMIAKIEAAQRPLRVRELADFATLYGVEVQDLVSPPAGTLAETDDEISEVKARLAAAQARTAAASQQRAVATKALNSAQMEYGASASEAAVLGQRLDTLLAVRQKLISWERDNEPWRAEPGSRPKRDMQNSKGPSAVSADSGPTVLRALMGIQLRRLRERNGIPSTEAARAIRASASKISRMELGRIRLREVDVADLLTLYGVTDHEERRRLLELTSQADHSGWWHDYSDALPAWFQPYASLQETATLVTVWGALHVPGLLQTEDYDRALALLNNGDGTTTDTKRRITLPRPGRPVVDRPNPPRVQVVLDEAALRRNVGGPTVMRDQLRYLSQIAEQPNVTIQIVPFYANGPSPGSSFTILGFADRDVPDVVCIEQLTSMLFLDRSRDVSEYLRLTGQLSAQALNPGETKQFLTQSQKQWA